MLFIHYTADAMHDVSSDSMDVEATKVEADSKTSPIADVDIPARSVPTPAASADMEEAIVIGSSEVPDSVPFGETEDHVLTLEEGE
jgi:hypothetical protein